MNQQEKVMKSIICELIFYKYSRSISVLKATYKVKDVSCQKFYSNNFDNDKIQFNYACVIKYF